jgi:hypothetical protein
MQLTVQLTVQYTCGLLQNDLVADVPKRVARSSQTEDEARNRGDGQGGRVNPAWKRAALRWVTEQGPIQSHVPDGSGRLQSRGGPLEQRMNPALWTVLRRNERPVEFKPRREGGSDVASGLRRGRVRDAVQSAWTGLVSASVPACIRMHTISARFHVCQVFCIFSDRRWWVGRTGTRPFSAQEG